MNPKPSLVSAPGGGPRRLRDAARVVKAAAIYFALVFGAGFALGLIRVPLLVPRLGERYAELLEMPPMFAVILLAAGWVVRRFRLDTALSDALCVGFGALILLVAAELLLAVALSGRSLGQYLVARDPVSGAVYLAMLLVFALMPAVLARRRAAAVISTDRSPQQEPDQMHSMTGMDHRTVRANGIRINLWVGGNGPPVLLLHGYPQTAQMWHRIAPRLIEQYTVVCPDLRGYGDSDKPGDGYDKKTMARDMHETMLSLGHAAYALIGHDRGARVAHRQALDYPDAVTRLCVLDIVPTHTVFARADRHLAAAYWHWFFFQTPDLPELMISAAPEAFLRHLFRGLTFRAGAIEEPLFQEYLRAFKLPGTIRAGLEDYRAAATRDFDDDERDLGRRVRCPVLAIWGEFGKMHGMFDVLATWKEKADTVEGHPLPCGHFIPEEAPEELLADLRGFLRA